MRRYTGLFVMWRLDNGKLVAIMGKTVKGKLRDHRKGKCKNHVCLYCMDERLHGADFRPWRKGAAT